MNNDSLKISIKWVFMYLICVSVLRGIFVPDFRYDVLSIVLIQGVYPLLLVAPLVYFSKQVILQINLKYLVIGLLSIIISQISAITTYYFDGGKENLFDRVSIPIFTASFLAQVIVFLILFWLFKSIKK